MLRFFMSRFLLLIISFFSLTACEASTSQNINQENIMSLLGKNETYIVSPPFEGHLYDEAKPLANVKIIRKVSYNTIKPNWDEDEFYTDENGYFNIPKKEVSMKLTFLDQFVGLARLYVIKSEQEVLIWRSQTMIGDNSFDFNYVKSSAFECDMSNELKLFEDDWALINTMCRWKNMPNEAKPIFD